mmetsp:Transcript_23294/g.64045  ORF Transcript_23294/g.64045 Transcript_23294/m.64045 type:complete len:119 (-) Transcript_23294:1459-1815(-)
MPTRDYTAFRRGRQIHTDQARLHPHASVPSYTLTGSSASRRNLVSSSRLSAAALASSASLSASTADSRSRRLVPNFSSMSVVIASISYWGDQCQSRRAAESSSALGQVSAIRCRKSGL